MNADPSHEEPAASDAEAELAGAVGGWRIDRVLGPVLLIAAVVLAVLAAVVPAVSAGAWGWLLLAPAGFALGKAAVMVWSAWRRRAWRNTDLDRVGSSRLTRIRDDLAAGAVGDGDRPVAARALLNEGVFMRSQGWVMLGLGSGQIVLAAGETLDGVRIAIGVVCLAIAAAAFRFLHVHHGRAVTLLAHPAAS